MKLLVRQPLKKPLTVRSVPRILGIVQEASQISPRPIYRAERPVRDLKYRALLRKLCCIVCGSYRGVEAAHFGPHGVGQKASDLDALPLCYRCHRVGQKSYHVLGARRFVEFHGLDVAAHQERIRKFYQEKVAA